MKPKTHTFVAEEQSSFPYEKGIKKDNKFTHAVDYNALMENEERTVNECRIPQVWDKMTSIKTCKTGLIFFYS